MSRATLKHSNTPKSNHNYNLFTQIKRCLHQHGSGVVLLSGGVDSALVAAVLMHCFPTTAQAVTVTAGYHLPLDHDDATNVALGLGIPHRIIAMPQSLTLAIQKNHTSRCYYCKKGMLALVAEQSPSNTTLYDGSTADDMTRQRPGQRALREYDVCSPLALCGITKPQIRSLARELGLSIWNKPSESCALTRFPNHFTVRDKDIQRVAAAEAALRTLGISALRLRPSGSRARLELSAIDAEKFTNAAQSAPFTTALRHFGFHQIELIRPYRQFF
ncbi:MAG: asparagine synthase-related protein [Trichlorobacter sp.]